MSLFKRKNLLKGLNAAINLAILGSFLANLAVPKAVLAKEPQSRILAMGYSYISQLFGEDDPSDSAEDISADDLPDSGPRSPDQRVRAVITAYSSTRSQTDDDPFTAASGKRVHDGMIAANWLPFGTKVKIPSLYGDKIFTVEDRMNARYGFGRMDIWMDAPIKEVRRFGVKRVAVEVYYD